MPGVAGWRLQKPLSLGHSHASMAATLAYRVLKLARRGSERPDRGGLYAKRPLV